VTDWKIIKPSQAMYFTFVISSFWHGFYPLYYIFFISLAVLVENSKSIYKLSLKYPFLNTLPAKILLNLFCIQTANYHGLAFNLLMLEPVFQFWKSVYFFVPVSQLFLLILFKLFPSKFKLLSKYFRIDKSSQKDQKSSIKKNKTNYFKLFFFLIQKYEDKISIQKKFNKIDDKNFNSTF
jgi:hypothetical protein